MNGAGDAVAIWTRGSPPRVEAAVRAPGGSFPSSGTPISGTDASRPDVAVDGDGDAVAVWERGSGAGKVIEAAVRPAGGDFGPAVPISPPEDPEAATPQVAMDPAGNAVAVWTRRVTVQRPFGDITAVRVEANFL